MLACNCIMDARKRHETPGSATHDFIFHGKAKAIPRASCLFLLIPMLPIDHRKRLAKFSK